MLVREDALEHERSDDRKHLDEILFECTTEVLTKVFNVGTGAQRLDSCISNPVSVVLAGSGKNHGPRDARTAG